MLQKLYNYQKKLFAPYFFEVDFEDWKTSFCDDTDGEGRKLFTSLETKIEYQNDEIVGFVQYGKTAFGFDEHGDISAKVSYPVIRMLYFDEDKKEVGNLLLERAVKELNTSERIYAFFHYFGMSCFARHGKLFESFVWIADILKENRFVVEHENVYYSCRLDSVSKNEIQLAWHHKSNGGQQIYDFILEDRQVGGCEIHYIENVKTAYLRWIYLDSSVQNKGIGSKCMECLKYTLKRNGYHRLDTDTALDNERAQHYYEKNGFAREGITRSYYTK